MAFQSTKVYSVKGHNSQTATCSAPNTARKRLQGKWPLRKGPNVSNIQQPAWLRHLQRNHTISAATEHMMYLLWFHFWTRHIADHFCSGEWEINYQSQPGNWHRYLWLSPFILSDHFYSHIETFLKRYHFYLLKERSLKQMAWVCFASLLAGAISLKDYSLENSKLSLAPRWLLCFPGKAFMGHELRQQHMTAEVKSKRQRLLLHSSPLHVNYPKSPKLNPTTSDTEHSNTHLAFAWVIKRHPLLSSEEGLSKRCLPLS